MSSKPKILIHFCHNLFVRNYLQTGVLDVLKETFELCFTVSASVDAKYCAALGQPRVLETEAERAQAHRDLLDILMFRHSPFSTSFKYRVFRMNGINLFSATDGTAAKLVSEVVQQKKFENARSSARLSDKQRNAKRRINKLRAVSKFGPLVEARKNSLRRTNPMREEIAAERADVVVCPSSAYDPQILDAINAATDLGIPSLLLIDNWDNASSKSIFWARPDYVACWGPQSIEHVKRIQGISDNVFGIGTPRFEVYRDLPPSPGSYVLFLGTALLFDEAKVLEELNKLFEQGVFPDHVKSIFYRPHPMRQETFTPNLSDLKHVELDNSLSEFDWTKGIQSRRFPDLDQYGPTLSGASLVICGYTSMMIEALLCHKPVLALAHAEPGNEQSPHLVEALYEHFKGTEEINGVTVCRDLTALRNDIETALDTSARLQDPALQHIISFTDTPFPKRLEGLIHHIMQEK